MTKIAHIADVHMRNLQYLDEIKYTFSELKESLIKECPDIIVVCGDIFHSKITPTHEYFDLAVNFFLDLTKVAEVIVIPGNHDLSLNNKKRMDAISPVINAIQGKTVHKIYYSKYSESFEVKNILFHHMSIIDKKKDWPKKESAKKDKVNIALYHGSINGCKVDNGWISRGNKDSVAIFDGFDFAMLGDVHICQYLDKEERVAYPGSLRQNNFGETTDKGYLIWEIEDRNKYSSRRVVLDQLRYFITIYGNSAQDVKDLGDLPQDSRIRFVLIEDVNISEQLKIKSEIEKLYKPCNEVPIIPPESSGGIGNIKVGDIDVLHENIRQPEVQKQLIKEYFTGKQLSKEDLKEISNLDKKYHSYVETDVERNVVYNLKYMKSNNTFSFGKDNYVDFRKVKGLVGVFGKNASGKSSGIVDNLSLGLYNKIHKEGANKNIDYINRMTDKASIDVAFSMNNKNYLIKRTYERKKTKDGEKCLTDFDYWLIEGRKRHSLNGEKKPDTNKNIRKKIGTEEDFSFTSLCAQFNLTNFIDSKATKRKESLAKYFDLNIFDIKYQIAKKDYESLSSKIQNLDYSQIETDIQTKTLELEVSKDRLKEIEFLSEEKKKLIEDLEKEIRNNYSKFKSSKFKEEDLIEARNDVGDIEIEISNIKKEIEENKKFIKDFSYIGKTYKEFIEEWHIIEEDLTKKKFEKKSIDKEKSSCIKTSNLIKKIPNVPQCKACPLVENAYKANDKVIPLRKKSEKLALEISDLERSLELYSIAQDWMKSEDSKKNIEDLTKDLTNAEKDKEKLEKKLEEIKQSSDLINYNLEINKKIKEKEEESSKIKNELANLSGEFLDLSTRVAVEKDRIKNLKENLKKTERLAKQKYYYELYLDAMSKNGISYWIISKKMPIINKQVNYILSHTVNFKLFIEDNENEKSIKIYIVDEKGKRPVELGSGMEKTIASIAIRAALWKICLLPKTPVLILDEAFAHLDSEKNQSVINLLIYLKNFFKIIFIITHDEELKSVVDHAFYVTKNDKGHSKLEIK